MCPGTQEGKAEFWGLTMISPLGHITSVSSHNQYFWVDQVQASLQMCPYIPFCEIVNIRWRINFVYRYFVGRAIHEFRISAKQLFS